LPRQRFDAGASSAVDVGVLKRDAPPRGKLHQQLGAPVVRERRLYAEVIVNAMNSSAGGEDPA
jgi:hypothetical protein